MVEGVASLELHYQRPSSQEAEASTLDNLGKIYAAEGDYPVALALWVAAYSLHSRAHYREDLRQRLEVLKKSWPPFAALRALEHSGDQALQQATGQLYRMFPVLDLSDFR